MSPWLLGALQQGTPSKALAAQKAIVHHTQSGTKKSSLNSQKCATIRSRTMWRRLKSIIAVHFSFVPSVLGRFLVFVLSSFSLFSWYLFFRPSPSPFACPSPRLFCSPSSSFLLVLVPVFSLSSRILLPFFFFAFASSFTPFSCFFFVFFFFSELSENSIVTAVM